MIQKVLMSGYDDRSEFPSSVLLPTFSKGFDPVVLRKQASIFEKEYDAFERKPGHSYIHLISVAAGDYYGPNSRADFYNGCSYRHKFPHPEKNATAYIDLDGGIGKYHNPTFMKHGGVYTEHFSSRDGAKPQGYIVAAKVNPDMHRGELIIGVKTDLWRDDIEQLSKGHPMKFSIGCDAEHDICSYCGRVAHTEGEHCDHYKYQRGQINDEGAQYYVISDKTLYHDISRVASPAEKIAFSIKKVASATDFTQWKPHPIHPASVPLILKTAHGQERLDTLQKLSKIEKEIIATAENGSLDRNIVHFFKQHKNASNMDSAAELKKFLQYSRENQFLGALEDRKCVLSPEDFLELFLPGQCGCIEGADAESLRKHLPGVFSELLSSPDVDAFCEDMTFQPKPYKDWNLTAAVDRYKEQKGMDPSHFVSGMLENVVDSVDLKTNPKTIIVCCRRADTVPDVLAKEYANYLVSATRRFSPLELTMTLLQQML